MEAVYALTARALCLLRSKVNGPVSPYSALASLACSSQNWRLVRAKPLSTEHAFNQNSSKTKQAQ